jgi:hypothetical protein
MVEDMAAFFSADEFATPATLDGVAVLGVFDNPYMQALGGMATTEPSYVLPTASAASVRQGAWLEVAGQGTYRVRSVQPDGTGPTGATTLVLEQRP